MDQARELVPQYELSSGGASAEDDERNRAALNLQRFRQSYDRTQIFRDRAIESYQFVSGEQWNGEDLARLRAQNRPAVVINMVLSPVLFLSGMQRQGREQCQLIPQEEGDNKSTEIMNALVHWYGDQCEEAAVDSKVFLDKIITGLGFWKIRLNFDNAIEGEPVWERVSPLQIFADPNWPDCPWEETEYVQHATWWKLDEACNQWPEHEDEIKRRYGDWAGNGGDGAGRGGYNANLGATPRQMGDSVSDRRLFWDKETQRIRILETWYVKRKMVQVAIDKPTGEVTADPQNVMRAKQMARMDPGMKDRLLIVKRPVRLIRMNHSLCELELDDMETPHTKQTRFPIFPAMGHYFWENPIGIVETMKDPQREKNKRRATLIELVTRMPHSGFFNNEQLGAKREELEEFASGNGVVINHKGEAPVQLRSPDLPQTLVYLDNKTDAEVNKVVSVNAEQLGQATQRTVSSRAIESRQRLGMVVQEPLLDTFELEKAKATKFFVTVVQEYTPMSKALRILGSAATRAPMSPAAGMMQSDPTEEILNALKGAFEMRFDAVVRSEAYDPSQNRLKWQTIADLAKEFGPYMPPQLLVDAAKNAGIITEEQAVMTLQYVQQQEAKANAAVASSAQSGSPPPSNAVMREG